MQLLFLFYIFVLKKKLCLFNVGLTLGNYCKSCNLKQMFFFPILSLSFSLSRCAENLSIDYDDHTQHIISNIHFASSLSLCWSREKLMFSSVVLLLLLKFYDNLKLMLIENLWYSTLIAFLSVDGIVHPEMVFGLVFSHRQSNDVFNVIECVLMVVVLCVCDRKRKRSFSCVDDYCCGQQQLADESDVMNWCNWFHLLHVKFIFSAIRQQ